MPNPFNPAPGAHPTRIVGREAELAAAREGARRAALRQPATPLVLVGQRGMGKTVLLSAIRAMGGHDALTVAIESLPDRSLADRLRDKVDALLDSAETLPGRAGNALKRVLNVVPKVSFELPHDAGAIALGGAGAADDRHLDHDSLVAMLTALAQAARLAKQYLTITVDEVQDADVRSMQTLTAFIHESAQGDAPILLAIAGLHETRDLIDKLRTYVRRWDEYDLEFLTLAETVEAIREPIVAEGEAIDEDALYRLAEESGGYPYFIAAFASAAWAAHRGKRIKIGDVERTIVDVRRRNEMSFYVRPLAKLTPREMALSLVLADLGPGSHKIGEIARALGRDARDISSIRAALARKGIISSPIPGFAEFSIPFTDRFIREHAVDYRDERVLAAHAELVRAR